VRRAVAEVFLIVIGILLALAASDWAEQRQEREREREILGEIREALVEDVAGVDSVLAVKRLQRDRVTSLLAHIAGGGGYADSLDASFGASYGLRPVALNRAAFESLKSQGLDLVSDSELRSAIARVYERTYPSLEQGMELERNIVLAAMRPHYLRRFRDLRFNQSATPLDYDDLVRDQEYINLLDYRRQNLVQAVIPSHEAASREMYRLIELLEPNAGGKR
jgi:hypothetical protein